MTQTNQQPDQSRHVDKPSAADCEVCGKSGRAAYVCFFEKACSCWYGVPCHSGESTGHDVRPVKEDSNG